jgi:hypothetical protein
VLRPKITLTHTVILIAVAVVALVAVKLWLSAGIEKTEQPPTQPEARAVPLCVGLSCNDDSDCGTKCRCEIPPGGALGKCVERSERSNDSKAAHLP